MALRDSRYGPFYGCLSWPACQGTHGAHKTSGEPLGVPANAETRALRHQAHVAFDGIAARLGMSGRERYGWLMHLTGKSSMEAHIGRFNADECRKLIARMS